ncbi:hypothetical protein PybrP1_007139 [[Pythium] brassicae (nom. inval.)]|nr:hypothetical protein PybrP1_007139 [[Pythium] brassicae (nom. inval.)]
MAKKSAPSSSSSSPPPVVFSTKKVTRRKSAPLPQPASSSSPTQQQQQQHAPPSEPSAIQRHNSDKGSRPAHAPTRRRASPHSQKRKKSSSMQRLQPASALLQSDQISVAQCVRSMVEKKTDATLLLDSNGLLTGILTDRDIAFKVVAMDKNPKLTRVCDVMTPNPSCVASNASAIDALKKMVSGQFRHLPVTDNEKVVGILDIAKCLYDAISKIEHGYELSPDRLSEAVKKLERHMSGAAGANLFETLRQKPDSTALDAAKLMLEKKTSAVMVCNAAGEMVGIFTSKDLMRRVVAVGIEPIDTALSSVMTTNPYSATLGTTILETLHSMHNGRFLHVPVFDEHTKLVGLVDVLQVTCGVVHQMGSFQIAKNESVQPLWDKFRSSLHPSEDTGGEDHDDGNDSESAAPEGDSEVDSSAVVSPPQVPAVRESGRLVIGGQTWDEFVESHSLNLLHDDLSDPTAPDNPAQDSSTPNVFVFKLADCYGTNHRFTSSAESLNELLRDVQNRLDDYTIRKVHYVDDDGDHVLLFKDDDLKDAVKRAKMWGNKYIRLIVPFRVSRIGERTRPTQHAFAHGSELTLGMVYYAAAAAAIAGASFFLSRRK